MLVPNHFDIEDNVASEEDGVDKERLEDKQ